MNKFWWGIGTPIAVVAIFYFMFLKMISPGYVGVVVDLLGDQKGVESKELNVGMHWIPPWKRVYEFPIFEQNIYWNGKNAFEFQTNEGMAVIADVGINFHLQPGYIPRVFQKYRRGMHEITNIFIRNHLRDALNKSASHICIEDLYGDGKEIFFESVERQIKQDLSSLGIEITRIYLIGKFHFPENVIKALNSKIEAIQRAQQRENELREAEAEAKKQIAKADGQAQCALLQARAEAEANDILSKSVTKELIQWQAVQKWDGKMPQVTGETMPFIQIK